MTKNIKGRKFVATAATAALVASAIVPVASAAAITDADKISSYAKEAVELFVKDGVITGNPDGSFNPQGEVTRAQAATMFQKALKLSTTGTENFSDVNPGDWYYNAVVAVSTAGIVNGMGDGTFNPEGSLTRAQAAKMIVEAYKLTGKADLSKYTDAAGLDTWASDALAIAVKNGVMNGTSDTTLNPDGNITREDFAVILKRAIDATATVATTVTAVSAINGTTLTVTGTGLDKLTAEDITLEGNKVASVTASTDGKTATIKLNNALLLDTKYTVEIKDSASTKSFDVNYGLTVSKVEVVESTVDNDTLNQVVAIKVNGQAVDYDGLAVAGYTVEFNAVDSSNASAPSFFKVASLGLIADSNSVDDYVVEVTIRKDGDIVVSDKGTIKVRNLELVTSSIKSEALVNGGTNDVAVQKSTTLVTGETLTLNEITTLSNGTEQDVLFSSGDVALLTSNPAVISVDNTTGVLTANTPGKAEITFIYGDVEKKVTYTVTNTARKVTKATPTSTSGTIIAGKSASLYVAAVDQYGDFLGNQAITVELPATGIVSASSATLTTKTTSDATTTPAERAGYDFLSVSGVVGQKGSGTILFKDASGKTIGSYGVKVTDVDNVATTKLEIVKKPTNPAYSADNALDLDADNLLEYAINKYTSEGVANGSADLNTEGYKVTYNADIITIGSVATGVQDKVTIPGTNLEISAKAVGSTDVAVYASNNTLVSKFRVTVTNTGYTIKSIAYKSVPTIDYAAKNISVSDVLTIVESDNDDIVKGITLNKALTQAIRLDGTTGELYIDANGNGLQDVSELVLGTVEAAVVTGATNLTVGAFDIFTGVTTASGDKGTLVFKVVDSSNTILSSTSVTVKVK